MIKNWKKIGKDIWKNKWGTTIRITNIGNPEYAKKIGLRGDVNDYAIELKTGSTIQYHKDTFKKKASALELVKKYMEQN